ncbi:MAG: hypothetical protein ABIO44_13855 [Saprospiraceae bacterium]
MKFMKETALLCFILFSLLLKLNGQSKAVLINLGVNKYYLKESNYEGQKSLIPKFGINLGFGYEHPIFKKVSIVAAFEFSQRNAEDTVFNYPNGFKFNYASFPISINFYLLQNFKFQFGAQYDHLIFRQKINLYSDPNLKKTGYAKYDLGINTGIRFQIGAFEINGLFNFGLVRIFDTYWYNPDTGKVNNWYAKSRMFKIGVSYLIK